MVEKKIIQINVNKTHFDETYVQFIIDRLHKLHNERSDNDNEWIMKMSSLPAHSLTLQYSPGDNWRN